MDGICFLSTGHRAASGRKKGFTLVELLVVIGIIVVLIAILLPVIRRARQQATRVACMSNLRQLGAAVGSYVMDNEGVLPYSNWEPTGTGGLTAPYSNVSAGWLYSYPPGISSGDPSLVEKGLIWKYLRTRPVYRCPGHPLEDAGGLGQGKSDRLTSYLMNGAVNAFPPAGGTATYFRRSRFKPDDVLMWEADERGGYGWNDGASYPGETFNLNDPYSSGLTARHGEHAAMVCIDGHAEQITHAEFRALATDSKRNRLWCVPGRANGR